MATIPTRKIKSTHPESQGDFVEINESDFDPAVHEPYEEKMADTALSSVEIPEAWADLAWSDLSKLAAQLTTGRVTNKKAAAELIEAELARRAETAKTPQGPGA